jgi:hypothetical protein
MRTAVCSIVMVAAALAASAACAEDSNAATSADPSAAPAADAAGPMPAPTATSGTSRALFESGRLLLTQGVSNVEGASGGGIASWATISGYETNDAIGGNAHFTYLNLPGYTVRDYGGSVGLFNRVEVSYTRLALDTGATGGKLGIGNGYTFNEDIVGAKVRLFGDIVYDQSLLPQVAVGLQYKHSDNGALDMALGAKNTNGVDFYVAATKLFLNESVVVNTTLRFTKANQLGLLGFGGDKSDAYHAEFEGSVGYLLTRRLVVGGEYRTKPDDLGFAHEDNWFDVFAAYAVNKNLSVTLAYANLGSIATFTDQGGFYVSVQAGF